MSVVLFVSICFIYFVYVGFIARPEWTVYGFFLVWVLVPKAFRMYYITGGQYDLPEGVTLFTIVEGVAALAILAALLTRGAGRLSWRSHKASWLFLILFSVTHVASFLLVYGPMTALAPPSVEILADYYDVAATPVDRILPLLYVVWGILFLLGSIAFITELKQIEFIFTIFILCGIELALETIVFYYLGLFPALLHWAVHRMGRFNGLVFTDYDVVGIFCLIAIGCTIYFSQSRRTKAFLWLIPLFLLPIAAGHQRAPVFGLVAMAGALIWLTTESRAKIGLALFATVALSVLAIVGGGEFVLNIVASTLGGDVRPEYFSGETVEHRIALQLRGLDVFAHTFPFGAGPGMLRPAMNSPISCLFDAYVPDAGASAYSMEVAGTHTTNVHNMFLVFVFENGMLGIVTLAVFVMLTIRNYRNWKKTAHKQGGHIRGLALAQALAFAILLGLAAHHTFENPALPFAIYFLFFAISLMTQCEMRVAKARSQEATALVAGAEPVGV